MSCVHQYTKKGSKCTLSQANQLCPLNEINIEGHRSESKKLAIIRKSFNAKQACRNEVKTETCNTILNDMYHHRKKCRFCIILHMHKIEAQVIKNSKCRKNTLLG
jgi:hypothetical protein